MIHSFVHNSFLYIDSSEYACMCRVRFDLILAACRLPDHGTRENVDSLRSRTQVARIIHHLYSFVIDTLEPHMCVSHAPISLPTGSRGSSHTDS